MNTADQEAKTIETYNQTAAQWTKKAMKVNDWIEEAKYFKELLPSGKILEVGCGGGRDAEELIRLGYDYVGTDASEGMITMAQQHVPSGTFKQLSIYDLADLGSQFDGFWACAVLLHMPKVRIDEALQAIRSVVKPGGIGMISIKDGNKEDFEVRDKHGMHEERLFVYWQEEEFREVLRRNGFSIIEYSYRPVSQRTNWHIFFVRREG